MLLVLFHIHCILPDILGNMQKVTKETTKVQVVKYIDCHMQAV